MKKILAAVTALGNCDNCDLFVLISESSFGSCILLSAGGRQNGSG